MNLLPVITRELRAESRRPFTYWLRTICAAALLGACVMAAISHHRLIEDMGMGSSVAVSMNVFSSILFGYANATLFASIWILVPMLAADCISREKREGTLGLLFLTPLKSWDIVISKSLVHGLRSLALYLTMLPILGMTLLFGGIGVNDLYMAFLIDSSALLLALSAGIMASSLAKSAARAMVLAACFSFILALLFMGANHTGHEAISGRYYGDSEGHGLFSWIVEVFNFSTNFFQSDYYYFNSSRSTLITTIWSDIWINAPADRIHSWFIQNFVLLLVSAAFLFFSILLAGLRIRRSWQDQPPSPKMEKIKSEWCSPVYFASTFQNRRRWQLDRNPISWLQQYSVNARLTKWGWCLFIVVIDSILAFGWKDLDSAQLWLVILLFAAMAYSSVSSFHREQESGALELLLVTPLRARHIVWGRGLGLWIQFLPAFIIQIPAMYYIWHDSYRHDAFIETIITIFCIISTYITMPWIGLYFAFKTRWIITGWLLTCFFGILLPFGSVIGSKLLPFSWPDFTYGYGKHQATIELTLLAFPLTQILSAALFTFLLHRKLANRDKIATQKFHAGGL